MRPSGIAGGPRETWPWWWNFDPPRNRKSEAGNPPPTVRALEFYPDHEHGPAFRRRTRPAQRNYGSDTHVFGQRQVPFGARLTGSNADLTLTPADVFPLERRDLRGA